MKSLAVALLFSFCILTKNTFGYGNDCRASEPKTELEQKIFSQFKYEFINAMYKGERGSILSGKVDNDLYRNGFRWGIEYVSCLQSVPRIRVCISRWDPKQQSFIIVYEDEVFFFEILERIDPVKACSSKIYNGHAAKEEQLDDSIAWYARQSAGNALKKLNLIHKLMKKEKPHKRAFIIL